MSPSLSSRFSPAALRSHRASDLGHFLRLGAVLLGFVVLDRGLASLSDLPESAYLDRVVLFAWFGDLAWTEMMALGGIVGLLAYFGRTRLLQGWDTLDSGGTLRLLIGVVTGLLAWWFSTLDGNPYFGQLHLVDRLLLLSGAALVVWRPLFVLPFLLVLLPFHAQLHHPLGGHSTAQITLPVNILVLFAAAHVVWCVSGRRTMQIFVFLGLCMIAASYLAPGLEKLRLGWLGHRHVHLMVLSSYTVGWLAFLDSDTVSRIARGMAVFDWPMVLATLVIECGAVVMMWRRATAMAWLAGFIVLNSLIWVVSGIFFWSWIAVNATLLWLLWRRRDLDVFQVFGGTQCVVSIPIILAGTWLFHPSPLAWLDVPMSYSYRLESTTVAGERVPWPTRFMSPYETHFALGDFGYIVDDVQLGVVWGAGRDPATAGVLVQARTAEEVLELEREHGANAYDPGRAERFDTFVRTVANRLNRGWAGRMPVRWLKAPPQVWSFHRGTAVGWPPQDSIVSVTVYQVLSFYDGERYRVLRQDPVREIAVEPPSGPRRSMAPSDGARE